MSRPLSLVATRAAYGARQLPRIAWCLSHGLAMTRIARRAREDGSARPRPHTDAPIPDRNRFFADMTALWWQDLANVEAGIYPLPADHDGSLKMLLDRSRLFFEDLPAVHRRRETIFMTPVEKAMPNGCAIDVVNCLSAIVGPMTVDAKANSGALADLWAEGTLEIL